MYRWAILCLVVTIACAVESGRAGTDSPDEDSKAFDDSALLKKIEDLVQKVYPKAEVERKDGAIRFHYKTRIFKIHSANLDGVWQNAHDERGPQPGGIYGEISLTEGEVVSMAALPQTFELRYYNSYLMGHYSRKLDCTIHAEVRYPPREAKLFVEAFEKLVNDFEKHVRKKAK